MKKFRLLVCLVLVALLCSACPGDITTLAVTDNLSLATTKDLPILIVHGETNNYHVPIIFDERMLGKWEHSVSGEVIEIVRKKLPRGQTESYLATDKGFFGISFITPYSFVVKGANPENSVYFTAMDFHGNQMLLIMEFEGHSQEDIWNSIGNYGNL
jgi:hypothetical protein